MTPLRRMLLGSGRLSDQLRGELSSDGMLLLEQELAWLYHVSALPAPGEYARWERKATSGAIAISSRRLVVWTGNVKHIDVPRSGPLRAAVEVTLDGANRVRFGYDAGKFSSRRSGQVEVQLRTPTAAYIVELLSAA